VSNRRTIDIWTSLGSLPGGKRLFGALLCWKAPYFRSISPRFVELRAGHCEVAVKKRRKILNHIGTVHAIAMCNMAELAGGTMTEVTIPATHRWIPRGMSVEYLRKAETSVVAIARPMNESHDWSVPGNYDVEVLVKDAHGEPVFRAVISMWVSPRKPATPAP
jgi:acyl-coenzyme A thioesterase PaaI-like protein